MAQILVRGLDDALVAPLKDRARQNRRSLQGEVRAILEEVAPFGHTGRSGHDRREMATPLGRAGQDLQRQRRDHP
jgi:plasmid stability protein